jgi:hypothetical protein
MLCYAGFSALLYTIPCSIRVAFLLSSVSLAVPCRRWCYIPFFSSSGNLVPFAPSLLLAIVKVAHRRLLLLYYLRVLLVYVSDTTWLEAQICT